MRNLIQTIKFHLAAREEGQGIVEYAVVLGVIVVGIATFFLFGPIEDVMSDLVNAIGDVLDLDPNAPPA